MPLVVVDGRGTLRERDQTARRRLDDEGGTRIMACSPEDMEDSMTLSPQSPDL